MGARRATDGDLPRIAATLTRAFAPYDFVRAAMPGPGFERRLHELYLLFARHALSAGEVWVAGDGAAAALWQPPGAAGHADKATVARILELLGDGREAYLAGAEQAAGQRPAGPHWYLDVLGTDPGRRREGLASAVLRPVLVRADADRLPVVVDTSAPENLPFYATHRFSVVSEYDGPEDRAHVWVLRREPPGS